MRERGRERKGAELETWKSFGVLFDLSVSETLRAKKSVKWRRNYKHKLSYRFESLLKKTDPRTPSFLSVSF